MENNLFRYETLVYFCMKSYLPNEDFKKILIGHLLDDIKKITEMSPEKLEELRMECITE